MEEKQLLNKLRSLNLQIESLSDQIMRDNNKMSESKHILITT